MADIWKDFVKQTVSAVASSGTGAFTLSTAVSGFQAFGSGDDGGTGYFVATEGTKWQTFLGTYTHSGTSLARTTPIDGSAGVATNETFTTAAVVYMDLVSLAIKRGYAAEQSITTTANLAWGQSYVMTGASPYTVTMPTAVGHKGEWLRIRMANIASMSEVVTVDGNGSETVANAANRKVWANECIYLESDGANVIRKGGLLIPMAITLSRTTDQTSSLGSGAWSVCLLLNLVSGPAFMQASGGGVGRVIVARDAPYSCVGMGYVVATSGTFAGCYLGIGVNGAAPAGAATQMWLTAPFNTAFQQDTSFGSSFAKDDLISLSLYHDGTTAKLAGATVASFLTVTETLNW